MKVEGALFINAPRPDRLARHFSARTGIFFLRGVREIAAEAERLRARLALHSFGLFGLTPLSEVGGEPKPGACGLLGSTELFIHVDQLAEMFEVVGLQAYEML